MQRSVEYLQKAASSVGRFEAYLIEDDLKNDEMVLRKIIDTDRSGNVSKPLQPVLFQNSLFIII